MNEKEMPLKELIEEISNPETPENSPLKELLMSSEFRELIAFTLEKIKDYNEHKIKQNKLFLMYNLALVMISFLALGLFAHHSFIPDGTTAVLLGIIIGFFFKRES